MFKIVVIFFLMNVEQPVLNAEISFDTEATTKQECEVELYNFEQRWRESNPSEGTLNWRWIGAECIEGDKGA